jgi:hypothetical protein
MNNNGIIDVGDISDAGNNGNPPTIVVSGNTTGNIVLTNPVTTLSVTTNHQQTNGSSDTYNVNFGVSSGSKRPVAVTLFSGPNVAVPYDMVVDQNNNGGQSPAFLNGAIPLVGDTYHFQVTYSDGTSNPDMTASVTAVLTSFARTLAMQTTTPGSPTIPLLTWQAPASPPASYTYSVNLYSVSGPNNVNWNYSGGHNSNGISSGTTNVMFNTDNSATSNGSSISSLPTTTTYNWSVTVQDANGNSAQETTAYVLP